MTSKAVVRHLEGDTRFTLSFVYSVRENSPGRQFNLHRELTESSVQLVMRIQTNVNKAVNKKKKKGQPDAGVDILFLSETDEQIDFDKVTSAGDLVYRPGVKMKVGGTEYSLELNPPLVDEVKVTEPVMTGALAFPVKLQTLFADESKTRFRWFITKDPSETGSDPTKTKRLKVDDSKWVERGEGFFFTPEPSDIGARVRLDVTPVKGDKVGDTTTVYSSGLVESGPDTTATLNRQAWTPTTTNHPVFRVMSYNILADLYADSDFSRESLFPQCPHFALVSEYRVRLIINELVNFNTDIISLQETDRKVYLYDLAPALGRLGFKSEFCKKGGQADEGLSLFYRESRFQLLASKRTVFCEELQDPRFAHIWEKVCSNPALLERLRARNTTVQISTLQSIQDPSKLVIVGNTHLYFKPDADHIRLLQIEMCLTEIQIMKREMSTKYPSTEIGVILCGDFNSTPPFGVLRYCTEGSISEDDPDWSSIPEERVENLRLRHTFNLGSALGTPKYTNYTLEFRDCLDYIFYDKTQFKVDQVIPFPTDEELEVNHALPNVSFPSDHISLVADLKWL